MKITEVEVINIAATKSEGVAKFIRNSPLVGPMEPYGEYAENRAMWTGGNDWIVPIVIIRTDEDIEGYGFCGGGTAVAGKVLIENHYKNYLVGSDPFNTEMLWDKMFRASIVFGRKGAAIEAISGVDSALWDIKGKALGVPVYKLLGGQTKDKIKLYASNLHPSNIYKPDYELLAKEALDYKEQGYKGMKQRMCTGPREGKKGMERNEMLVKTVREAVGDDIELMLDAYMAWADVDYAIEMINRLEKYNLTWVEEPFLPDDFDGYRQLRKKTNVPIAAGEHEYTRFGFKELITRKIVDVVQPDIRRMGGLTEAKKVAALCEAFNVPCAPHVAYAETIHFTLSCPAVKWAEDTCVPTWEKKEGGFSDAYVVGAPKVKNGFIEPDSEKPGLGIKLNMEVIDRLKV
ncbi:MAG: enolase C-terminal domain-like protein [Candidatus Humimicrobiaceae bacterium]